MREADHKLAVLVTRRRIALQVLNEFEHLREDARRRHELNAGDIRSELEAMGVASLLIALRNELDRIEAGISCWKARRDEEDRDLG
ncbi:MAG: hypothetical protein ACRDJ2_16900 [Actinomycetota bacterium]